MYIRLLNDIVGNFYGLQLTRACLSIQTLQYLGQDMVASACGVDEAIQTFCLCQSNRWTGHPGLSAPDRYLVHIFLYQPASPAIKDRHITGRFSSKLDGTVQPCSGSLWPVFGMLLLSR